MATNRRFEIPDFFPQPKVIELGEGISELSRDVRLATSNVSPLQRKSLRSILTMSGVRVVANKKKYVVDARVEDIEENPQAFELEQVPEECRCDYYEIKIQGSEVYIRSPYQQGMVWAAQTLGTLFKMMINGMAVPNMVIRDWPVLSVRGILADCSWSTDRMELTDWRNAIDTLSEMKLNVLGVGIYDCLPEQRIAAHSNGSEFMMTPLSNPAEPRDPSSNTRYRYYNVKYDRWYDKSLPPAMFEEDFFGEVITYGHERGVTVFPVFNILGRSTLLPRLYPALSAKNANGEATGDGICLTSPEAREAVVEILDAFLGKYFPEGCTYFHLGGADMGGKRLRRGDDGQLGWHETWCQCPECADHKHGENLASFLQFLVPYLVEKGVEKVVLFSDHLEGKNGLLEQGLNAMLKANPEIRQHLLIQWEALGNETNSKLFNLNSAKKYKLDSWVGPVGCQENFSNFIDRRQNIEAGLKLALENKCGIVSRCHFDPAYVNHYALLGVRAWETPNWDEDNVSSLQERWAQIHWPGHAKALVSARENLCAAAANPSYQVILPPEYFKLRQDADLAGIIPPYPGTALELLKKEHPNAQEELTDAANRAAEAFATLSKMLESEKWSVQQSMALQSLFASSLRIAVNARFFLALMTLQQDIEANGTSASHIQMIKSTLEEMQGDLRLMEVNSPNWLTWITMQQLGCHKLFLEQLLEELQKKTPAAKLRWSLPNDWEAPEDL